MDADPLSTLEAEHLVRAWMDRVGEIQGELSTRLKAAGEAEADYKVRWAQEYLQATGTMEARKATATLAAEDELRAKNNAQAVASSAKEAADNARSRLSAAQSLLTHARTASHNATGYGA